MASQSSHRARKAFRGCSAIGPWAIVALTLLHEWRDSGSFHKLPSQVG